MRMISLLISNRPWQKSDKLKIGKNEQNAVKAAAVSAILFSGACVACLFFGMKGIALRTDRSEMFGMDVAALFIFIFLLLLACASIVFAVKIVMCFIRFLRDKSTSDQARADFFKGLGSFCRSFLWVGLCLYVFIILTAFYVKYSLFWVFAYAGGVLAAGVYGCVPFGIKPGKEKIGVGWCRGE